MGLSLLPAQKMQAVVEVETERIQTLLEECIQKLHTLQNLGSAQHMKQLAAKLEGRDDAYHHTVLLHQQAQIEESVAVLARKSSWKLSIECSDPSTNTVTKLIQQLKDNARELLRMCTTQPNLLQILNEDSYTNAESHDDACSVWDDQSVDDSLSSHNKEACATLGDFVEVFNQLNAIARLVLVEAQQMNGLVNKNRRVEQAQVKISKLQADEKALSIDLGIMKTHANAEEAEYDAALQSTEQSLQEMKATTVAAETSFESEAETALSTLTIQHDSFVERATAEIVALREEYQKVSLEYAKIEKDHKKRVGRLRDQLSAAIQAYDTKMRFKQSAIDDLRTKHSEELKRLNELKLLFAKVEIQLLPYPCSHIQPRLMKNGLGLELSSSRWNFKEELKQCVQSM